MSSEWSPKKRKQTIKVVNLGKSSHHTPQAGTPWIPKMNLFPTKTSTTNGPVLPQRSSSSRPFGELTPGLGDLDLERPERLGGQAGIWDIITCKDGPLTRGVSKVKYTPILSRNIFLKKYVLPFYKATFIRKSHFSPIYTWGFMLCHFSWHMAPSLCLAAHGQFFKILVSSCFSSFLEIWFFPSKKIPWKFHHLPPFGTFRVHHRLKSPFERYGDMLVFSQ